MKKTALIVGASGAIGSAVVTCLRMEGWSVICHRSPHQRHPDQCDDSWIEADLAGVPGIRTLGKRVGQRLGGDTLDLVVYSAGVYLSDNELAESADRAWRINALAPYLVVDQLLPRLSSPATVVLLSSVASQTAIPGAAIYGATKAALDSLTRSLARRLVSRSVGVFGLAPVLIRSAMSEAAFRNREHIERITSEQPLSRFASAEDVAHCVAMLAREECCLWFTGTTIVLDGARLLGFGS